MSKPNDHDIANALFADLETDDALNDTVLRPAPHSPDASGSSRPEFKTPPDQDASGSSSLSDKTPPVQDFSLPKPLPPSDAFLPRRQDAYGSRLPGNKTSAPQDSAHHPHQTIQGAKGMQPDNHKAYLQPGRVGRHRIQRWIGPATKRQIKLICINHDISEQDFFGLCINMGFAHFNVPRIAFESDTPIEDPNPATTSPEIVK